MDLRKVKKLIELVEESGIDELEIQEGEESVRISRNKAPATGAQVMLPSNLAPPVASAPPPVTITPNAPAADSAASAAATITAPMVGTYYSAPAPGAKPFVTAGQTIKKGDVVCIIEAMKMMNQIEADRDGVVQSVLLENGDPVEFGQPLIALD